MHVEALVSLTVSARIRRASVHMDDGVAADLSDALVVVFALPVLLSRRQRHGR